MVGLSSIAHNNKYLFLLYHPTQIVDVVVVVVTTLIGGELIFIIMQMLFRWPSSTHMLWLASFSMYHFLVCSGCRGDGYNDGSNSQWWFYSLKLEEILAETKGVIIDFIFFNGSFKNKTLLSFFLHNFMFKTGI